jgi:hypothetical protein
MSGATTAAWVGAAIAGAGAIASNVQANKQARQQRRAAEQAEQQARRADEQSRQAMRKQNAQQADVGSILAQNQNEMLSGGSTLLTGAQGVAQDKLNLGKGNTLG